MFQDLLDGLCQLVYPPECFSCNKSLITPPLQIHKPAQKRLQPIGLCPECLKTVAFNKPPFCLKCSRHLGENSDTPKCSACSIFEPHYDFAWGSCLYSGTLIPLVHQFKYGGVTFLRHLFLHLMNIFINKYQFDIHQFDYIVPVPLHPARQRERGYNQSRLLSLGVSAHYLIPLMENNLLRSKPTKSQTQLGQKERWTNIDGAFRIRHPWLVKQKSILIIDDLLTTGATASEAALALKGAGAKRVGVLTLAIAP